MTTVEVLNLALSKEKQAIKLYQNMAVKHPAVRELLNFLANEEMKHKKMIEEEISRINRS